MVLPQNDLICRTCSVESRNLNYVYKFTYNNNISAVDMIRYCTKITLTEDDGLPVNICNDCITNLKTTYDFIIKCHETNTKLREKLKSSELIKQQINIQNSNNGTLNMVSATKTTDDISPPRKSNNVNNKSVYNKNYKCEVCNKRYTQHGGLICHMRTHTGERPFLCSHCGKGFIRFDDLLKHTRIHTGERPFRCKVCSQEFKQKFHLAEHERSHSKRKEYSCDQCNKKFARYGVFRTHKRTHTGLKPYTCTICPNNKVFVGSDTLTKHMIRSHHIPRNTANYCKECNQYFAKPQQLLVHMKRTHSPADNNNDPSIITTRRSYTCNLCSKTYTQQHGLNVHVLSHTGERPYLCAVCGKTFIRSDDLTKHSRTHTQERPYICTICPTKNNNKKAVSSFTQSFHLVEHMRTHNILMKKSFSCSICDKSFTRNGSLRSHLKIHTRNYEEKQFECKICDKRFSINYSLTKHMLTHTGERPYRCNACSKAFTQSGHLVTHLKIHSGEKPHACQVCGKTFAVTSRLTVHMRTHTGEKPYVCPVCGKGCTTSTMLKVHIRTHTGETPYQCQCCLKSFSRSDLLNIHRKNASH